MRWLFFVALWLHALTGAAAASEESSEEAPRELTPQMFKDGLPGRWLVKFYSPYCHHCTALQPKWAAAYRDLGGSAAEESNDLHWGAINCVDHGDFCSGGEGQGIKGYPTIRVYKNAEKVHEYGAKPQEREGIRDFALKLVLEGDAALSMETLENPIISESPAELKSVDNLEGRWAILFGGDDRLKWLWTTQFLHSDAQFGIVDCGTDLCPPQVPAVRIYNDNSEEKSSEDVLAPFDIRKIAKLVGSKLPDAGKKGKGTSVADAISYASGSAGLEPETDPSRILFGHKPDYMQNSRTHSKASAAPPGYAPQALHATKTNGKIMLLAPDDIKTHIFDTNEPWIVIFTGAGTINRDIDNAARALEGELNFGAIDCNKWSDFCRQEGAVHYPYITFYRGPVPLNECKSSDIVEWARNAARAQIVPVDDSDSLRRALRASLFGSSPAFLYVADDSVMPEDWDSAALFAYEIACQFNGTTLRSNSEDVRKAVGMDHGGISLMHVEAPKNDIHGYPFPQADIPLQLRTLKKVVNWASSERFTSAQPLQVSAMVSRAPLVLVRVGASPAQIEWLSQIAELFHIDYVARQRQDQEDLRMERKRQHDVAVAAAHFDYARRIYKTQINAALRPDLSFGYVDAKEWKDNYSRHFDRSDMDGSLLVVDFSNSRYVPIIIEGGQTDESTKEVVQKAVNQLLEGAGSDVRSCNGKFTGVPSPKSVKPPKFEGPILNPSRVKTAKNLGQLVGFACALFVCWSLYRYIVRPHILPRMRRGPILPKHE